MRIGILTLPLHTNYGGILQAYALQTVLRRMGHDVVVFDTSKKMDVDLWKHPLALIKRSISKYILRRPVRVFYEKWHNNTYPIISQYTQLFLDKYIHRLEISTLNSLSKDSFDALIVGSDQVWRPMYFTSMYRTKIQDAYLAFACNWDVKRIAYAPSFGTNQWEYSEEQTKCCSELLRLFDVITVREQGGIYLCQKYLGVNAQHVLDPTMLLDSTDYIKLIEKADVPKSKGNMLCYVLDETAEKTSLINSIAKEKKMVPFRVNSRVEDNNAPVEERIQPPVESWLRGFYDAEFVVTDSFHACVFSILFKKPFLVISNVGRGVARFESLLSMFGLQDRMITINDVAVNQEDIDWDSVYAILEHKRQEDKSLLSNALA